MRCRVRLCGLKLALRGTLFRGPALNCQTTPSVRPLKWQLAQPCQPRFERRFCNELVPGMLSKLPREEKNISAPTRLVSPCEPGAGRSEDCTAPITVSLVRSTTETLRETKLATKATVPELLMAMPWGFLPAFAPMVAGLVGSFK